MHFGKLEVYLGARLLAPAFENLGQGSRIMLTQSHRMSKYCARSTDPALC